MLGEGLAQESEVLLACRAMLWKRAGLVERSRFLPPLLEILGDLHNPGGDTDDDSEPSNDRPDVHDVLPAAQTFAGPPSH